MHLEEEPRCISTLDPRFFAPKGFGVLYAFAGVIVSLGVLERGNSVNARRKILFWIGKIYENGSKAHVSARCMRKPLGL